MVCKLVPGHLDETSSPRCRDIGRGYHSWDNMGDKYKGLKYFNQCAVPYATASAGTFHDWGYTADGLPTSDENKLP